MKVLFKMYRLTLPLWLGLNDFIEMMRYSQDFVIAVEKKPNILIMGHRVECEDEEQYKRALEFFRKQILERWRSFGCKVEEIPEDEYGKFAW